MLFFFSRNLFRTGKQLFLLTSSAGYNTLRSSVSSIAFGAGKEDFYSKIVELNTKVYATELSKGRLNASAYFLNESHARSVTSIPLMNGGYSPQGIDILFDEKTNSQESRSAIAVSNFKIALSSQLICNLIATDIHV